MNPNGLFNMTKNTTIYTNARLLDASCGRDEIGSIIIENGIITAIGKNIETPKTAKLYDCKGLCLSAGFLDIRVALENANFSNRTNSTWKAAAAGGVTSLVCLPDTEPCLDNPAMIDLVRQSNKKEDIKLYCYGTMTRDAKGEAISELGLMQKAGAVAFTDGRKAIMRADVMLRLMLYSKNFDALLVQHPEDAHLAAEGVMNMGEVSTRLGLPPIPKQAETAIIARDLELLRLSQGRYHIAHVSCADSLRLIRQAKKDGLDVTCDTAPHYFALNENAIENYRSFAKVSPPLRNETDRAAITQAIADGTIDIIASDHIPQNEDSKRLPFASAAFGVIGLETLLPISLQLVHNGTINLLQLVKLLTIAPAKRLRLPCGDLAVGSLADITIFDPDIPWQLQIDDLHDNYKNTAFEEHFLQGKIVRTICGGSIVYDDKKTLKSNDRI